MTGLVSPAAPQSTASGVSAPDATQKRQKEVSSLVAPWSNRITGLILYREFSTMCDSEDPSIVTSKTSVFIFTLTRAIPAGIYRPGGLHDSIENHSR